MIRKNVYIKTAVFNSPTEVVVTYIDDDVQTYTDPNDIQAVKVQMWQQKITGANSVAN